MKRYIGEEFKEHFFFFSDKWNKYKDINGFFERERERDWINKFNWNSKFDLLKYHVFFIIV